MSEPVVGAPRKRSVVSRRGFIKLGALGAGALGASKLSACAAVSDSDESGAAVESVAYTYHPMNCGNRCSLKCTVRDGRLAHIQGNDWQGPESRFSICCFKGMSEIQHVYSPDRLQKPLKRTGARGEGAFEAISWDEALDTVATALKESNEKHGRGSILFAYSSSIDYPMPLLNQLLGAQTAHESGIDMGQGNGYDPAFGDGAVGIINKEIYDWVNSRTILLVGSNVMETSLTEAQYLLDAKEEGARVIVVDPMQSATAAKADWWVPIEPGTDIALYLGMLSTILDKGWYKEDFMRSCTSLPFLVGSDGKLLRDHAVEEVEDETGPRSENGEENPFLVWDSVSRSVKPYNEEGVIAALEGAFEYQGSKASPVFALLKESQKAYSAAWASELTGIPVDDIEEIARAYALDSPSFLGLGFGTADKIQSADITGHTQALLAAVTGNVGEKGTGIGILYSVLASEGSSAELGGWALPEEFAATPLEMQAPLLRTEPNSVRVLVNHGNAPVQHFGNWNTTKAWLEKLDFIVTIDPYYCDSADWSDIVLPATTCFEMREECGNIQLSKNHVLIQQKVIEPLFDSKTDFEIEQELGARLGFSQYLPKGRVDLARTTLTSSDPKLAGITYDSLMKNKALMRMNVSEEFFDVHAGQTYATPSGCIEVYRENVLAYGLALPRYEAPVETALDNPLRKKYPLKFWQTRRKYRVHSTFQNSTWIGQVFGTALLHMNPQEAAGRGLQDGDAVRVFNDRGSITATLMVDNALRPGSALIDDGPLMRDTGGESFQTLINDELIERGKDLVYGAPIPFYDTLVEVAKA